MNARIWKDEFHGGYWFSYDSFEGERFKSGPFRTFCEAEDALVAEQEELSQECEGANIIIGEFEVGLEEVPHPLSKNEKHIARVANILQTRGYSNRYVRAYIGWKRCALEGWMVFPPHPRSL